MTAYNFKNLSGERFGLLTVLERDFAANCSNTKWICRCDCGEIKSIDRGNLITGRQISCGCENRRKAKESHETHNLSKTSLYKVWVGIITRCYNEKRTVFKHYGGRGITMCDEWRNDFLAFKRDMGNGYSKGLQIDRIRVNDNYEPSNCRWVTAIENSKNKRNNVYITVNGVTKIAKDWATELNLPYTSILKRIKNGEKDVNIILYGTK